MSDAKKDGLGARMKSQYEDRARFQLPRRAYTLIRVDGRAFHTLLRGAEKPFDPRVTQAMTEVLRSLTEECGGSFIGYCQSDEASVVLQDFKEDGTQAWFDGNVQKIASISASIATATFNQHMGWMGTAHFDARCWSMADPVEVANYLVWRQKDWKRNAIQMIAQSYFSAKELHGKSSEQQTDMIIAKGWREWESTSQLFGWMTTRNDNGVKLDSAFDFTEQYDRLLNMIPRIRPT